jgi:hypothetical protein
VIRIDTSKGVARVAKYHTEAFARDASRPGTRQMLVLGDVDDPMGKWWVCSGRDASRLASDGYEYATSLCGLVSQ